MTSTTVGFRCILIGLGSVLLALCYLAFFFFTAYIGRDLLSNLLDMGDGWIGISHVGIPAHFSNFWLAGWSPNHGDLQAIYHRGMFVMAPGTGPEAQDYGLWPYPPPSLPLVGLVALLPPRLAFMLWTLLTPVLAYGLLRRAGYDRFVVLATICSPLSLMNLTGAQRGLLLAMVGAAGVVRPAREQLAARGGLFLGLLVIKPGTMLLVPVALFALRDWRSLCWAVVGGLGLTVLALALYGTDAFALYWQFAWPGAWGALKSDDPQHTWLNATTIYWSLRSLGVPVSASMTMQIAGTMAMAVLVYVVGRLRYINPQLVVALPLILSPMASPHGISYDMVGYSGGLALAVYADGRRVNLIDGVFWLAPLAAVAATTIAFDISIMPLVILAAAAHAVGLPIWRATRTDGAAVAPAS